MNRVKIPDTAKKTAMGYPWPLSDKNASSMVLATQLKAPFPRMILPTRSMCTHMNNPRIRPVPLWRKSSRAGSLLFFLFDSMV